jgi:hypothetical protein
MQLVLEHPFARRRRRRWAGEVQDAMSCCVGERRVSLASLGAIHHRGVLHRPRTERWKARQHS